MDLTPPCGCWAAARGVGAAAARSVSRVTRRQADATRTPADIGPLLAHGVSPRGPIWFLPRTLTHCSLSDSAETCRENKTGSVAVAVQPPARTDAHRTCALAEVEEESGGVNGPSALYSAGRIRNGGKSVRQNEEMQRQREDGLTRMTSSKRGKSRSRRMGGRLDTGLGISLPPSKPLAEHFSLPTSLLIWLRRGPCQRFLPSSSSSSPSPVI